MVYYAFFHSVITYGLVFWGNTTNSAHVFKLQKRVVRIMVGTAKRDSCKKKLDHYKYCHCPLYIYIYIYIYIYYLVMYIVNNLELFVINFNRNTSATKNSMNLYLPIENQRVFQKGQEFFGIKVYNNLPGSIKQLSNNKKKFKEALLLFLYFHSFHNIDEFFSQKNV
jgi:hypothetical protein